MKKKLIKTSLQESDLVRKAAEQSIMASNTVNPIIALTESTKAVQIIETLHDRYGPEIISDICKVNTREMLNVLQNQKERILQDVMKQFPSFLPPHPLNEQAMYVHNDREPVSDDDREIRKTKRL